MCNDSTVFHLMTFAHYLSIVDNGCQLDATYTDLTNVCDKVNHHLVLFKLYYFSFSPLIERISSNLINRKSFIEVLVVKSKIYVATSGVSEDSRSLGPLVFPIFIYDITSLIKYLKLLFPMTLNYVTKLILFLIQNPFRVI